MDTAQQPSCLECIHWASRWNTVPRKDGCQVWAQVESLAKEDKTASVPSGTSPAQDGLVCPRFALYIPSPKDDLTPAQLDQLSLTQQEVRSLYAKLCRLERSVAKLASFQGVEDASLCREVSAPAHDLQRFFRPLKTEISSFDEVLSKGFRWKEYVAAFLARTGEEASGDSSDITGSDCLGAFALRLAELKDRFAQVESKADVIQQHADELPAIMAERQEAARKKRIEGLQEDYDWEFKEALIRYRGLNQRILHLHFFERAKRDELIEQRKRQLARLEKINEKYADTGVKVNDLSDLDVASGK